ncbi:MAG: GbsR/MarR family transcriptional regulator [Verrucomicrobiota bacterium]
MGASRWRKPAVQILLNSARRTALICALPASPTADAPLAHDPVFEQECVALFSSFLHVLGVPNSIGAIYGLLFASPEPLCFADIVERLEMSKGSVSQGLAFLRQSGAVKAVEVAGDRREFFEPELGLRRLASGLIQEKIQPLTKKTKDTVARLKRSAESAQGGQRVFQMERIRQLETWHKQLGRVLPVVQTILNLRRA